MLEKTLNNSIVINKKFLNDISEEIRVPFINYLYYVYSNVSKSKNKIPPDKFINNFSKLGMKFVYKFCPYCKTSSFLLYINRSIYELSLEHYCGYCGELNLLGKEKNAFDKIKLLLDLVNENKENITEDSYSFENKKLINVNNILSEQIIVLLATTLEVFLKDVYSTYLNISIVKYGTTEINRFRKECKNAFMNSNKIIESFKGIGINLKKLDKEVLKDINQLFLKRHVIVHNNGVADKDFISQSGLDIRYGDPIKIDLEEINKYTESVKYLINQIGNIFKQKYYDAIKEEFEYSIFSILQNTLVVRTKNYRRVYTLLHSPDLNTQPDITKIYY